MVPKAEKQGGSGAAAEGDHIGAVAEPDHGTARGGQEARRRTGGIGAVAGHGAGAGTDGGAEAGTSTGAEAGTGVGALAGTERGARR
jgi:endoglucanase